MGPAAIPQSLGLLTAACGADLGGTDVALANSSLTDYSLYS